ncbi:hypothetical protein ACJIZ3_005196 [Penstemon smallii]|uniref:Fe-S metabolism associated domain-containing protein n=1 Tax=Penstemon smallii TaxID=265156 RepID=A0ABD3S471_9LAMI
MDSFILNSPLSPFPIFPKSLNPVKSCSPSNIKLNPTKLPIYSRIPSKKTEKCNSLFCLTPQGPPPSITQSLSVSEKVQSLDFEFKSLPQPIDRVKRLLHYATLLPPFDESSKIQENRVMGCTAQVWLNVKMDDNGVMRFRVDSDSEITKGFCSCLIWVLDGAEAEDVLMVKTEDLIEMNIGFQSRGNSRVNMWNNVLISMQKRTKILIGERGKKEEEHKTLEAFSSLFVVNGGCKETKSRINRFGKLLKDNSMNELDMLTKNIT